MDEFIDLILSPIDICRTISLVTHESCGAVATFIGILMFQLKSLLIKININYFKLQN